VERIYALSSKTALHLFFIIEQAPVSLCTSAISNKFHHIIYVKKRTVISIFTFLNGKDTIFRGKTSIMRKIFCNFAGKIQFQLTK
jgi:hypothetical protein